MKKPVAIVGLNADQYEAVKKAAKAELPFTVNIRICKRQYAYGAIDIRPKAPRGNNDPFYKWTEEEFKLVLDFVLRHGLVYTAGGFINEIEAKENFSKFQMQYLIHGKGFNFLRMVEGNEIKVAEEVKNENIIIETNNNETSDIELAVENVIDYSTEIISDEMTATYKHPETEEEKAAFASKLDAYIVSSGYDAEQIKEYMKANYKEFKIIINALETITAVSGSETQEPAFQASNDAEVNTVILSNEATHYGFIPDTIDTIIEKINTYTLDPIFEGYGNFIAEFKPMNEKMKDYVGYSSIFGNFLTYSSVFRILTNDKDAIDRITAAIKNNQNTLPYKEAKLEIQIEKEMVSIAQLKFSEKEIGIQEMYQLEKGSELYQQVQQKLTHVPDPKLLEQTILKCEKQYEPTTFEVNWGSSKQQGKRIGKMVIGAMSDAPRGIKTYNNVYGNLPDYETIKADVHRLNAFEEFRYVKARDYGLNHPEAYLFANSMDTLQKYWSKTGSNNLTMF